MKPLSSLEIKLCQKQAKIFEESIKKTNYSSLIFIRRFMHSSIAKLFDEELFLFSTISNDDVFDTLDEEFGESTYGKEKYSEDEMFWIGYIYRCICIRYKLTSKAVFRLFNAKEIVKYYYMGHTFDIVDCAERMMEKIGYDDSPIEEKAYKIMKRLIFEERLKKFLGQNVDVIVDDSANSNDEDNDNVQNYGYTKELKGMDKKYQDVFIIGEKRKLKEFNGKIIAIVKDNNNESKLVVCDKNKNYTKEEIIEFVNLKGKYTKNNVIMFK